MTMTKEMSMVIKDIRRSMPDEPEERLIEGLSDWQLHPHFDGEEMTGVKMIKGTEFHFVSCDGFKLNRANLRKSIAPHMESFGFLTTRVEHHDKANQRFNKLFGFQPTWADERFQYFILTELPFGERASCQQSQ